MGDLDLDLGGLGSVADEPAAPANNRQQEDLTFEGLFVPGAVHQASNNLQADQAGDDDDTADLDFGLGPPGDVGGCSEPVAAADADLIDDVLAELGPEGMVGESVENEATNDLSPLEAAWNSRVRRAGDMVGGTAPSAGQRTWTHGNTYVMDAAVREAFLYKRHKQRSVGNVDIDSSHRELEGVCSVASLTQADFRNVTRQAFEEVASSGARLACCVCRYFDGTPSFHDFGSFSALAEQARYVKEIPAGTDGIPYPRFTTMSYADMVQSRGGRLKRIPQRGILELLTRRSEFAWTCVDDFQAGQRDKVEVRQVLYPPCVVKDTTCATLANVLTQDGDLLTEVSKTPCPWMGVTVIHDLGDGAKPNKRWKRSQREQHKDNPNVLYDEHSHCAAHSLHNAICAETKEDRLVGHVHAVMTVLSVASRREHIINVFRKMVAEEIEIIDGVPPQQFRKHSEKVLEQTLLRRIELIRSRLGISGETGAEAKEVCTALREACKRLISMLNGDITRAPIQHYEFGCCASGDAPATKAQIVENIVTACIEAGLFGHRTSVVPAKNRSVVVLGSSTNCL